MKKAQSFLTYVKRKDRAIVEVGRRMKVDVRVERPWNVQGFIQGWVHALSNQQLSPIVPSIHKYARMMDMVLTFAASTCCT